MQLNVIRGEPQSGKTTQLEILDFQAGHAQNQIISAASYTPSDLELLVHNRVGRGFKVVCIDECSEEQIALLQDLQRQLPGNLTIHAVVAN